MDYKVNGSEVYLSLGSNQGDREAILREAIALLNETFGDLVLSPVYETPPLGFEADIYFLNMCVGLRSDRKPYAILKECQRIERSLGRIRKTSVGYESRPIDIDILYCSDTVLNEAQLTIPHQHIAERKFVLKPLSDIAASFVDPQKNKTIASLLSDCNDKSRILLYKKKLLTFS